MNSFKFQNKKLSGVSIVEYYRVPILVHGLLVRYDSEKRGTLKNQRLRQGRKVFLFKEQPVGGHQGWAEWLSTRRALGTLFQLTP